MKSALRGPRYNLVAKACAAVGILAGSLGAVPGLPEASIATASPTSPPLCTTSTTVVWLYIPAGSAAAGSSGCIPDDRLAVLAATQGDRSGARAR